MIEDRLFEYFDQLADLCAGAGLSEQGFVPVYVALCRELALEDDDVRAFLVGAGAEARADLWRLECDASRFRTLSRPKAGEDR